MITEYNNPNCNKILRTKKKKKQCLFCFKWTNMPQKWMAIHAAGTAMGSPMTHLSNIMSYTQLYSCILFDQKWKPESRLFGCCKTISYNMYSRALSHPALNWWSNSLALACFWDGTCSHMSWVVLFFFCLVAVSAGSCSLLEHEAVARGYSLGLPWQGGTCKTPMGHAKCLWWA